MNTRHRDILDLLRQTGEVSVDGLAAQFGVTLQTIRRDLTELAEAGRVERVHGGAVLPSGVTNIGYEERRALNQQAKRSIGERCARLIPNDCALFLGIGTTTEAVATALIHHRNLMVVTNNMTVASILGANAECETIVTGGHLRAADGGLVGPLAVESLHRFKFDFGIIGCSALDADGDVMDFDLNEVMVSQEVLRRSRRKFLVCDHSKLTRSAPARIASLAELDIMVTDGSLPSALHSLCADHNTQIDSAT